VSPTKSKAIAKNDLLVEIGTEELPPKALIRLAQAFESNIKQGLEKSHLEFSGSKWFASPRRLAVIIEQLASKQQDRSVQKRGPAVQAAYDKDGNPTKAALGFAKSCGVEIDDLQQLETDKGTWLVHEFREKGRAVKDLIPEMVTAALDQLPIPKRMRWGDTDVEFVRPVHWLVLLFGDKVIKANVYDLRSSNLTYGHRFHKPKPIEIDDVAKYEKKLMSGKVIADLDTRRDEIKNQIEQIARKRRAQAVIDPALLDEVTSMVEWPVAVEGQFDPAFLDIPSEALVSAMKNHQKYFHMVDADGKLLPRFITISNIESKDPKQVKQGNERVIRPRLSDATFFWQQDRKSPLETRLNGLKTVVFQNKLGTLFDKSQRMKALAMHNGAAIGADPTQCARAAELAKCDLMTEMVGEFPELQGIMGRYYASHDKEPEAVAAAIDEHYQPRFSGDSIPENPVSQAVALADKIDTLVGIFGVGLQPTGDKDPFALRRAALGCIHICIESKLNLDFVDTLQVAFDLYNKQDGVRIEEKTVNSVYDFVLVRLEFYYASQQISANIVNAVACLKPRNLFDIHNRIQALVEFQSLAEAEALAAANKRISNILKKSAAFEQQEVDQSTLVEPSERALAEKLVEVTGELEPLFAEAKYSEAMKLLAGLRDTVDQFFDDVMVNVDDEKLRNNRLTLLKSLRDQFLRVADISKLQS
jgi:glycyl-tRNA synthetase beta chain